MIAYLDNSATTKPFECVISAMEREMREGFYNPSSLYAPALQAEKRMDKCREAIEKKLGAPGSVVFTSGGTEANNLAILGYAETLRGKMRMIVSSAEHPSVLEAFRRLEQDGHDIVYLRVDGQGQPDWAQLEDALTEDTALISCMLVNNETGAILDIKRLSAVVRERSPQARIHCDCVQGFLRVPFDASFVDMVTVSGHKLCGPKGIGALWVRKGVRLLPRQLGGGQESGLRSGTENTCAVAGLLVAIEEFSMDETMMQKKCEFVRALREGIGGLVVNGAPIEEAAPHIVNVSLPDVRAEVMLHALEVEGVYCSTGSACSSKKRKLSHVLLAMGVKPEVAEGALRFSLSPETTREELSYAAEKIIALQRVLSRYKRR